jgi:hypothetical protein
MAFAGIVGGMIGIDAENKSLEEISDFVFEGE